jgi:hypothetical protein
VPGELAQVVGVRAVTAVTENHPGRVDAFVVAEESFDGQTGLAGRVGVNRDGGARPAVGLCHGPHHPRYPVGSSG